MSDGCAVCREMAPLACDQHAQSQARERQGYLDVLSEHEHCSIQCMMHHEEKEIELIQAAAQAMSTLDVAYHIGRRDALRELIEAKTE